MKQVLKLRFTHIIRRYPCLYRTLGSGHHDAKDSQKYLKKLEALD